ncbi:MAG: cation efflux protein [Gemmatimonadetes bacterium]|nr:cation efflux protein [Gemmatimonadota bacterium]
MSELKAFIFPAEQQQQRRRAAQLSWLSLVLLSSTAVVVFLSLGQSEAMKTAWIEDLLGLVPPLVIIVALRIENRAPTKRYPFGYFRAVSIAFLVTSTLLTLTGAWLLFDSLMKLVHGDRPPVGTASLFGHSIWLGWLMIAALSYCVAVGILLGRLKQPVAASLNDRALAADADMNKAGWMSEGAAIAGILLIGYGKWWGDSLAAAFISLNIIRDGWVNLRQVVADLMDEAPTKIGGTEMESLPDRVRVAAESLHWVKAAAVRLREHGHVIMGEVFLVPHDELDLVRHVEQAAEELAKVDWRIYTLTVMPVSNLEPGQVAQPNAALTAGR